MKSIRLKNFKAFRDEFDEIKEFKQKDGELMREKKLFFDEKNFLLYGDNGSGKSSLYEAIKLIYFRDKTEVNTQTPEGQKAGMEALWESYQNKQDTRNPFIIEINDTNYQDFDTSDYQVFMVAMDSFCMYDSIKLDELLSQFDLDINIEDICENHYSDIEEQVNNILKEFHEENIEIVIDKEEYYGIKVIDSNRGLETMDDLSKYFNEAKLNLIVLLLLFESIKISQLEEKKKILVLDDFITSLDVSNRTFLMRYLFDNFAEFQILIFTHNVYFYNLIMYLANDIYTKNSRINKGNWIFANLYEINNQHKLYIKGGVEIVKNIRDFYNSNNSDIESTGNKIRQRFEVLLYEYSKLFMVGGIEESKKIIERIENSNNIYFKKNDKKQTASDLVDEIAEVLSDENQHNLQNRLNQKITHYKQTEFNNLQDIIRKLKLYKKVTMHPMSHGTIGHSSFTTKDIEESLDLLEKLEGYLKDLTDNDVDGA